MVRRRPYRSRLRIPRLFCFREVHEGQGLSLSSLLLRPDEIRSERTLREESRGAKEDHP